jgi:hypothetical protein
LQDKQAGWEAVWAAPPRLAPSPRREQAHNAIARQRWALPGCPHPGGRPPALLPGLAPLSHLIPSQCRAQPAGQWGVAVEGGRVPTADCFLHLPILTSGGFRCVVVSSTTQCDGMWEKTVNSRVKERICQVVGATLSELTMGLTQPQPHALKQVTLRSLLKRQDK